MNRPKSWRQLKLASVRKLARLVIRLPLSKALLPSSMLAMAGFGEPLDSAWSRDSVRQASA
ncbi:hypothetical protein D3C71_1995580 [compost metagenome]